MSSPFQQKFMAKNPAKGFTLDQLKKSSDKAEKQMKKNAAILPQIEGPGNPDYESTDPQKFAGDDTYTYEKKTQVKSPLDQVSPQYGSASAYVSIQPALQNLQKKAVANSEAGTTKGKKPKQVVDTSTGDQVGATKKEQDISKPTRDSELAREKYNTFQDSTRVQSIDGNFYRVDGKGNINSMKFDELGKRVFDMDKVSKAMGKFY